MEIGDAAAGWQAGFLSGAEGALFARLAIDPVTAD